MSNPLRVETDELLARAKSFDAEAEDSRLVSASDGSHVESRIAAFGEISAVLHDMYRSVHAAKQRSWDDQAAGESEHGDKLRENVHGYDSTDSTNARDLGQIDDMQGGIQSGPAQVRPSFPGLHETPHPYVPGADPNEGFRSGVQGPFDVPKSEPVQVRPAGYSDAAVLGAVGPRPPRPLDCESMGSPGGDDNSTSSGPLPPGTPRPAPGTRRPGDWVPGEPPPPGWTPPRPPPLDRATLGERCYDPSAPPI